MIVSLDELQKLIQQKFSYDLVKIDNGISGIDKNGKPIRSVTEKKRLKFSAKITEDGIKVVGKSEEISSQIESFLEGIRNK